MSDKHYPLWKPVTKDLPVHHFLGQERSIADKILQKSGTGASSDSTSPIVAQDLAPDIIPVFVRNWPFFDMVRKVPANGLSHTYLQQTSFSQTSDPNTIAETGTVNDDSNSYQRLTSNVAVFAIRRSVSMKAQFAGNAVGGPSADLYGKEVVGGMQTLARDVQNESLRFQTDVNNLALSNPYIDPNGKYDANGFNGLRYIANVQTPPENSVQVDIRTPWTDQRVLKAVRKAVNSIWDKGGKIDLIVCNTTGSEAMFEDELSLVRYVRSDNNLEIIPGLTVRAISTDQGLIPVLVVPGQFLGQWSPNLGTNLYQDILLLDTDLLEMPYLGSPVPSIIRIPTAVSGQLTEVAIPFCMYGLAALAPSIGLGRVSLQVQ